MGYMLIFAVAIILWLAISIIILMVFQSKKEKDVYQNHSVEKSKQEQATSVESYRKVTSKEDSTKLLNSPLDSHLTWKEKLEEFPGISGWVLIRTTGDVLDISDSQYESAGASLAQMVEWLGQHVNELEVHQPRSLELETKHGSILILFPKHKQMDTNLILFLDKESYWNDIRESLSQIDWDNNSEGVY